MANDFKVGDVVQLKSGSNHMTVVGVGDNEIECKWFNFAKDFPEGVSFGANSAPVKFHHHQIGTGLFPSEALELVKNNK